MAAVRGMQQIHGNRTTTAFLRRAASATAAVPATPLADAIARAPSATASPSVIQRTNIAWETAISAEPTAEGGMGGVIFIRVGGTTHVLKAAQGSAAPTMFGERVLHGIGGARTTDSDPVKSDSPEGVRILTKLNQFKTQAERGDNDALKTTWGEKFPFFNGARYLMVQQDMTVGGGREYGRTYKRTPREILDNPVLLNRIGLSMAADALIGNADRWEMMNTGNAFVDAANRVGAIDTEAIFSEYTRGRGGPEGTKWGNPQQYGRSLAEGHVGHKQGAQRIGAPASSPQGVIFGFDRWFDNLFKGSFTRPGREGEQKVAVDPAWDGWAAVKASIKGGLDEGLARVHTAVTGPNYKTIKHDFKQLETQYGADPNFDIKAFQIKSAHMRAATEGADQNQARLHAEEWAEVLVGPWADNLRQRLLQLGQLPAAMANAPAAPVPLTKTEKFTRAPANIFNALPVVGSDAKKQANAAKKQMRSGEVRAADVNLGALAVDPHAQAKLAYEQAYLALKEMLAQRAADLRELAAAAQVVAAQVDGGGYKQKLAKKKLKVFQGAANAAGIRQLTVGYKAAIEQWKTSLHASGEKRYVREYGAELERLLGDLRTARDDLMREARLPALPGL